MGHGSVNSIDSDALRANVARTARPAAIPDRYQTIIAAAGDLVGVRAALTESLQEYFHPYRNDDAVITGLAAMHLQHWPYLARSTAAAEVFDLVAELSVETLRSTADTERFSALLRTTLIWCQRTVDADLGPILDDSRARLIDTLGTFIDNNATAFLNRDTVLHGLLTATEPSSATGAAAHELYRRLLHIGYQRLAERLDVPGWAASADADLTDTDDVIERFAALSGATLTRSLADIERRDDLRSPEIASYSSLITGALAALASCRHLEDRLAVCLFLLKDDTLGHRQQQALGDLLSVIKRLIRPDEPSEIEVILTRLTAFFRHRDDEFPQVRLACYEAIGRAIGQAGDERAASHLLDDVLSWRFPYPEISGATDDWQTLVNPNHLPVIRCWLAIIESNPSLYERLTAALNVQLRFGGVYIADTDLFQRDITRFLNADIADTYFVAKQLLRVFPVYFSEVGAEGELRTVSTHLDESTMRRDTLLHFLRKQVHAESSNRLVPFSAAVLRYWLTLDPAPLRSYISPATMNAVNSEGHFAHGPHRVLTRLRAESNDSADDAAFVDWVLTVDHHRLLVRAGHHADHEIDAIRVAKLVRVHQLLRHKYSLTDDNLAIEVTRSHRIRSATRDAFVTAHTTWLDRPTAHDALLDASLDVLAELRDIILDREPKAANEQLFHKRHIAAGIPSIYGSYREPKFDALGLSLRVENLVARLLEDVVNRGVEPYLTLDSLRRITAVMRRFERALAVDGISSGGFSDCLRMLEASFSSYNFSFHQYHNVFTMLARAVSDLSARSVRSHNQILKQALATDPRLQSRDSLTVDALAEGVLRDVLVGGLGIQTLDRYVGAMVRKMADLNSVMDAADLTKMMNYDPERLVYSLHDNQDQHTDLPTLGAKGLGLVNLARAGHRIPEGFVLSTELFHVQSVLSYRPLREDTERRIGRALRRLEKSTGRKLGSTAHPLLLSVRSGSPISMPGLMTTFVNVGLNAEITEQLAGLPGFAWAAWDSYRRFLQSWSMYEGMDRAVFDAIINDAKERYGVGAKLDFTAAQMREVALGYRAAALDSAVTFVDDPVQCLLACIRKVVRSWDGSDPRLYREYAHIAENWGTAVVCQRMVFGNRGPDSGSGVVFTSNPLEPYSHQVRLFGDFAVGAQGEDLVGGLVFPLPISEVQRQASATYANTDHSLETRFPEIYAGLLESARAITEGRNADPQEIEFTFESSAASDLYILQKRAIVQEAQDNAPYIDAAASGGAQPAAFAMGAAGGAYAGRVAITAGDVEQLLADDPDGAVILVRPDTVPEDLTILTRVDGFLTARGGATSHAAVTAKRLGKTAVVGCHTLSVHDAERHVTVSDTPVAVGQWLTIDGRTGNIYLGRLPMVDLPPAYIASL